MEGRKTQEGADTWLTHVVVQKKPMQHCKAIFLQLKNKKAPKPILLAMMLSATNSLPSEGLNRSSL